VKHGLGGVLFENDIRERFHSLGWDVETTPIIGELGADLIARVASETIVIQCKDYGSPLVLMQ
jgi:hypothetical protein